MRDSSVTIYPLDAGALQRRIESFSSSKLSNSNLLAEFEVSDKKGWNVSRARAGLRGLNVKDQIVTALYRPFDYRHMFYNETLVWGRSWPTLKHLVNVKDNVALIATKVTKDVWDVGCTTRVAAHKSVSAYDTSSIFPLLLEPTSGERPRPNLSPAFTARLAALTRLAFDDGLDLPRRERASLTRAAAVGAVPKRRERGDLAATFGTRDVFDWIYAIFHSPAYRERYADFLKSDFARIPLPRDRALFAALIPLGTRLVALHLLDAAGAPELANPKPRFVGEGEARVEARFPERHANGRVYINGRRWFEPVPESVWTHPIGGYRPAEKWLKDRSAKGGKRPSPGRVLTDEDILHYRRMVVALEETAKTVAEIDAVIARHGGWPDAFRGMTDAPLSNVDGPGISG